VLRIRSSRKQVGTAFHFFDSNSYIASTNLRSLKHSVIPTDVTFKFKVCLCRSLQVS